MALERYRGGDVTVAERQSFPPALGTVAVGAAAGLLAAGVVALGQAVRRRMTTAPAPASAALDLSGRQDAARRVSVVSTVRVLMVEERITIRRARGR